ncbi:DUF748 domain-containing protein [Endozoicomonas acroporae]|uniref:DUF748 domain-containing protein n=1 Tax=Endozoicomonas acroporae TaxID=1701104 RepID=UPI000C776968|nr:hypothetical protein [Endozoicomonas acroporae]
MWLRKVGGFQFVGLLGLLFLGGLSISGWWWFARVSDRVLNSLHQQTGQRLPDKDITFDPWQRRLTGSDIRVEEQGIQFTAQKVSVVLNYRHWWGAWFGEDVESLSGIELDDVSIAIDPELIAFTLPTLFQRLSINRGRLFITGIDQPLSFDQLTLANEEEGRIRIYSDSRDGESWSFSGVYEVSKGLLDGEVRLVELPLSALVNAVPLYALAMLNNELSANDRFSGTVSATLSLSWDKPGGLILKGNAEGRSGQLLWSGLSAQWQQWHLNNLQFHGNDPAQSRAELAISGLDLRVPEALAGECPVQLMPALPTGITSLAINDSRLELANGHSPWVFENVNGRLVADGFSGKEKDSRTYQFSAALANIGDLQLSGQLSGSDNDFAFQLNDARLAGPLKKYSAVAGYDMQGSQFDLSYNSQNHTGQLDISDWQAKKIANSLPVASIHLLKALITDSSGRAAIPFSLEPGKPRLTERIYRAVEQHVMTIVQAPLDYLSNTTGRALEPVLYHEAGKATLTKRSQKNLVNLKKALIERPELNVLINVGVSESRDWPEFSRYELEKTLLELYAATSSVEPAEVITIPPGVRASLVEQMYLATRRHQKIPEVAEQSPGQRVQEAESWLLKNWPKTPDQLESLQKARYDYLKSETGTASGHIELQLSSGPDRKGGEPVSVLTLH